MQFSSRFVGRIAELDAFDAALMALEDGVPRAIEVVGPAGIGKSRLLFELAARADARSHVVLTGSGAELEQDLPYWVFVDALDDYVDGLETRRLDRLDAATRSELGQLLPALADSAATPETGLHERYRTHRAARRLLEQLAMPKPLVLLLDDFHWADPASADLLSALLRRPPAAGVLIAIAARPAQLPSRLATALERAHRAGLLARVELPPLTVDETRNLVGEHADALYEESGGNPFYLEQLSRGGATFQAGGEDVVLAGVQVPPQVAAVLTEELALLSGQAQKVLDGASVAGDPFELDLAAAAAELPEADALDALDELLAADLVRGTDMPRRFRFRHPIVRRAVYEAAGGGWRIRAHERVAGTLAVRGAAPTGLAHHVERCGRHGDEAAIATLIAAGRETASRAPATSARWFDAAIRLLPDAASATQRVELLLAAAQARIATGGFSTAHASLLESLDILPADAAALRTSVSASCASVEHLLGMHERAHERLLGALDELPEQPTPEAVSLMIELSLDGEHRMQYEAMVAWAERAAELAGQLGDPASRVAGVAAAARAHGVAGQVAEAARWCNQAAALIDGLPDRVLAERLAAITMLATAELFVHRFADAHAHAERAIAIGRATGQGQQFPQLFAFLGISAYLEGQLHIAVDPLDAAVEAARLTGHAQMLSWSLYARSLLAFALGDIELALSAAQESLDLIDDGMPNHNAAYSALALAEATLAIGKSDGIINLLERTSGGPAMPLAAPSWRASFLKRLTKARLMEGDLDGAARAAQTAQESASEAGLPFCKAEADRAAAAVALRIGDAAHAAELALGAAELNASVGAAMETSRSLILAGRALSATGDADRARDVLKRAATDLDERGAVRFRDSAERELRQLGERIHRRSRPANGDGAGLESLTERELEIARRIVDRRTNREIAEELFLSRKTVETHIRNIFGKLGADSRVEVARIVERADRLAASA